MNYSPNDESWQAFSDTDKIPMCSLHAPSQMPDAESYPNSTKRVFHFFSADNEERQATIRLLKQSGKDACLSALPVLLDALRDQTESVRVAATEAIGILEESIPMEALLYALSDRSWNVRAAAAQSLGNAEGITPISYLVTRLSHESDVTVREAIVRVLGKQGDFMPIPVLTKILSTDPNWLVREAAAWALGELGNVAPTHALIAALLGDPDESVRAAAAKSLGKSQAPEAEDPLWHALNDGDEDVRIAVGWALQQFDEEIRGKHWGPVCHFDEPPWSCFKEPSTLNSRTPQEEIFFALTQFISDKKGWVCQADVVCTSQGQTLLIDCFYQTTEDIPHETFLRSVNNAMIVQPIESALSCRDDVVQTAAKRAMEAQKQRPGNNILLVSFALSHPDDQGATEKKPLRIVVSGIGCSQVREKDTCVLDQIVDTWVHRVDEPLGCEHPHDLTDLKIWYHSPSVNGMFQESIAI